MGDSEPHHSLWNTQAQSQKRRGFTFISRMIYTICKGPPLQSCQRPSGSESPASCPLPPASELRYGVSLCPLLCPPPSLVGKHL